MRSPRIMSILLYALGAGLLFWSGLMLLSGDTFATLDIAASLAGSGALTIGLGAIVGALDRVIRTVEGVGRAGATSRTRWIASRREEPIADIVPVFVPRGAAPAHFEPLPEPTFDAVPEPKSEPVLERRPEPKPGPAALSADGHDAPGEPGPTRKERRARKLLARQQAAATVETPPVAAPALGGGFSPAAVRRASAKRPVGAEPEVGSASATGKAGDRPDDASATAEMFERARPIMPVRAPLPAQAEPPPLDDRPEPSSPDASETGPAAETERRSEPATDATGPIADLAAGLEPTPPAPPSEPTASEPKSPLVEPQAPAPPPDDEPKVPDWLARARARREARAKAELPAELSPDASAPDAPAIGLPESEPESESESEDVPPPAAADPDTDADEPESQKVVSEGEHNGVLYRFYDDGSVEAVSAYGVRRFASVDELRETVRSVRGPDDFDTPFDAAIAGDPAPGPDADPLDAALAELEREPAAAPELKVDPQDRPGPRERW